VSIVVLALGFLLLLSAAIAPPTGLLTLIPRLRPNGPTAQEGPSKGSPPKEKRLAAVLRPLALWSARGYVLLILLEAAIIASLGNIIFVPVGPRHGVPLYLGSALLVAVLAAAVMVWRRKLFRPLGRVHYTAFAVAQVLFVAWMGYWGFFFV
jgi:hypothetical protein